jgi:WD40 repeat protein
LISWSHDNALRSWYIDSGKTKQVFEGHSRYVNGALIQGETLISWSGDNTLRSWDIDSGKTKQVFFEWYSGSINGALIRGETLISWSGDTTTLLSWDIDSGKIKKVFFEAHTSAIHSAVIQDNILLSIGSNELIMWNLSTAGIIKSLVGKGLNQFQVYKEFLYMVDGLNTIWMYHFPELEYACRLLLTPISLHYGLQKTKTGLF